jgi:TetR/AcrR family transcriptional regulator, tetracycline repressor protein
MGAVTSRDEILDAAMELIDREGVDALSMRSLAAKLDVAVTAIYHHVGNRRQLEEALLERIVERGLPVTTTGGTPERRVLSTARSLLAAIGAHSALMGFAQRNGRLPSLAAPARTAIARSFSEAGLRGAALADATEAVVMLVAQHAITRYYSTRWPSPQEIVGVDEAGLDRVAVGKLRQRTDADHTFEIALRALVRGLLPRAVPLAGY